MPAIDSLALRVEHAHIDAGRDVFQQGEPGDHFYVIADGEADIIRDGRLICTIGARETFGEVALLRETTRTTTVRARTSLRLYTLDGRDFVSAVSGYPSSGREPDSLVLQRLGSSDLRRGPAG